MFEVYRKSRGIAIVALCSLQVFMLFGLVLLFIFVLVSNLYFPDVGLDNLIFHVRTANLLYAGSLAKGKYISPGSVIFSVLLFFIFCWLIYYSLVIGSAKKTILFLSFCWIVALAGLDYRYHYWKYIGNKFISEDFYEQNYVKPELAKISFPTDKKNLVLLYLESIESTYQNERLFGENLLPSLSSAEQQSLRFDGFRQTTGTGWSMASVVAGSCGISLNLFQPPNQIVSQEYFLRHIVCLQDILDRAGYFQGFIKGGHSSFAGLDLFLDNRAEGKIQVTDSVYFFTSYQNAEGEPMGAKDSLMYEEAKKQITEMAAQQKPFFMTLFTLNTHFDGYLEEMCDEKYGDFRDNVKCADLLVGEFIEWFQKQSFAKDTVLIVSGDHLAMGNNIYGRYLQPYPEQRRIYFSIYNSRKVPRNGERDFTALDLFPTILESLGAEIEGGCLGLGCSILSSGKTLYEKYGAAQLEEKLSYLSRYYDKFIFNY